jgi:HPt (histidine-containing phosphotransfer) domain-containing protein
MRDIDHALERVAKLGGEGLVERLIAAALDNAAKRVASAREALAAGDLEALGRAAHSLKSSAANLGAARLVELAREIEERSARAGGAGNLADLVGELSAALDEVRTYLKGRDER